MSLISMLCPRCLGDSFERDHAYKCRPPETVMTPTVPPRPAQGETAGVRRYRTAGLGELPSCAHWGGPDVVLASDYDALRQQLADSAHEVERLNAANAAMRGALRLARPYVAWQVDNTNTAKAELALIDAALAPTSHDPVRSAGETRPVPERGKCRVCNGTREIFSTVLGDLRPKPCPDCAQGGSPADPEQQGTYADTRGAFADTRGVFTSPPPTAGQDGPSDLVAGLRKVREYIAQGHYEYGGRGDEQLSATDRAIAALERAK